MENRDELHERERKGGRPTLFCSFVKNNMYQIAKSVQEIKKTVKGGSGMIFILENKEDPDKIFIVYNTSEDTQIDLKNTIRISRYKQTNTLYTISALNELTKLETDQETKTDKGFTKIDWSKYQNTLIVAPKNEKGERDLKIYHTKLQKIETI